MPAEILTKTVKLTEETSPGFLMTVSCSPARPDLSFFSGLLHTLTDVFRIALLRAMVDMERMIEAKSLVYNEPYSPQERRLIQATVEPDSIGLFMENSPGTGDTVEYELPFKIRGMVSQVPTVDDTTIYIQLPRPINLLECLYSIERLSGLFNRHISDRLCDIHRLDVRAGSIFSRYSIRGA